MPQEHPDDYAIVVGVNKYQKHPHFQDLEGAVNDARDFIKWLKEDQGLADDHIYCFLSEVGDLAHPCGQGDVEPRLGNVYRCIENLLDRSEGGEKKIGRRIYIFMAGHGVGRNLDETGLLAADHSRMMDRYLVGKMIADIFAESAIFDQVVLFMDCCRDYDGDLTPPSNPFRIQVDPDAYEVDRCYCYGAKFNRQSHEKELENDCHGVFSWSLLKGLRFPDEKGKVTARRLKTFVTNQIKQHDSDQEPDFPDSNLILVEGLQPVLVPVTVNLPDYNTEFQVWDGHSLENIDAKRIKRGERQWDVKLVPGKLYCFAIPSKDSSFPIKKLVRVEIDGIFNESDERIDHVEF